MHGASSRGSSCEFEGGICTCPSGQGWGLARESAAAIANHERGKR